MVTSPYQPIVAIVNEVNYVVGAGMSYSCFSGGTKNVSTPLLFRKYGEREGWYTGIQVQNIGATRTDVTVTYRRGGETWTEIAAIDPGQSANFWQGHTDSPLPDNFIGSAVITSTTQPIVAIVNEVNYELPGDASMSYGGINY